MSYRLKLNALHFASSLNDEKDMLENSQLTLESEFGKYTSSSLPESSDRESGLHEDVEKEPGSGVQEG